MERSPQLRTLPSVLITQLVINYMSFLPGAGSCCCGISGPLQKTQSDRSLKWCLKTATGNQLSPHHTRQMKTNAYSMLLPNSWTSGYCLKESEKKTVHIPKKRKDKNTVHISKRMWNNFKDLVGRQIRVTRYPAKGGHVSFLSSCPQSGKYQLKVKYYPGFLSILVFVLFVDCFHNRRPSSFVHCNFANCLVLSFLCSLTTT